VFVDPGFVSNGNDVGSRVRIKSSSVRFLMSQRTTDAKNSE